MRVITYDTIIIEVKAVVPVIVYNLKKKQYVKDTDTSNQIIFAVRSDLNTFDFVDSEMLKYIDQNPRPIIKERNTKIFAFKTFESVALALNENQVFFILHENVLLIVMDSYDAFTKDIEPIMFETDNIVTATRSILKVFITDLYVSFYELEDQLINLEGEVSKGVFDDINLDLLSSLKHDCMMAEKNMRRIQYIVQDVLETTNDPSNLMGLVSNNNDYANHLVTYTEHLILLYNSLISEKTNKTITRLTIFTVFATPISILSGIYGMNFANLPGSQHEYGLFIMLGIMALMIGAIYIILKKKDLL